MGRNIKRCFLFMDDLEGIESYFTDMSANGWELKRFRNLATFERRNVPECNRYRLDVFNANDPAGKDRISFYEDAGWKYVTAIGIDCIQAFRAPQDTAIPELHTDPASLAANIELLKKRITRRNLFTILFYAVMILMQIFPAFINQTMIFTSPASLIMDILFLIILIYFSVMSVRKVRSLRRLIDCMKNGRSFNHHFNYKNSIRKVKAITFVPFSISLIFFVLCIYSLFDILPFTPPVPQGSLQVLSFANIPPFQEQIKSVLDSSKNSTWANFYKMNWSPLLPKQYTLFEEISPSTDGNAFLISERYHAITPWISQMFFQALINEKEPWNLPEDVRFIKVTNNFFDDLRILKYSDYDFELIAKRGVEVYYLDYNGPEDSQEDPTAEQIVQLLQNKAS